MTFEDGPEGAEPDSGRSQARAELIERLWRDPKARSRNRNFYRFRDEPSYRRAARHVRSLRALRADIIRWRGRSVVRVEPGAEGEGARVILVVPSIRLRRSLRVSELELELLRDDAAIADLLPTP